MQQFGSGEQREPERAFETGKAGWMNWSQESKHYIQKLGRGEG